MPIFIPLFIIVFIVVPLLIAKMAWDLLGIRSRMYRLALVLIIGALNWQLWQAPKAPQPTQHAQVVDRQP